MISNIDKFYMQQAISLATRGEGLVNPNPMVGAIIIKNNKIIGKGYHEKFGGNHAEVNAINNAIESVENSTLYVTLEPCSHFGNTPPCADLIVKSKIKRCIIGSIDPNSKISGKGIEILKNSGIEIKVGVLKEKCEQLNNVFLKYITTKIPYIFLKCAITLDGKIATKTNNSKWITNDISRKKVQVLRKKYMSILVGINTLNCDNPSLTYKKDIKFSPYRIVVDPNLKIFMDLNFVKFNDNRSIIVTSSENLLDFGKKEKINKLKNNQIKLIYLDGKKFKMKNIIFEIGKFGIDSILIEGGNKIISESFREDIVDEGEIFIAPKILGDKDSIPFISGFNCININDGFNLENVNYQIYGNNVALQFKK